MSLIQCSLAELHTRFVAGLPDEPHRQRLWDGWMRFRSEVEVLGIPYVTWLGGSFLTSKSHPGDIDQCVVIDAADYGLLAPPEQQHLTALMTDPSVHTTLGCHAFPITNYPVSHPRFVQASIAFTYWTRVFGIDRADRHRSILCVSERGTV